MTRRIFNAIMRWVVAPAPWPRVPPPVQPTPRSYSDEFDGYNEIGAMG